MDKFISPANRDILKKRFFSFVWRGGVIVAVAGLNFLLDNVGLFEFNPQVVVFAGLVISEITKWLNTKR